jgi:hypothetical protein
MTQTMTQTKVLPVVETIFEWDAKWSRFNRESRSHCLLRIFINAEDDQAVVIASELHSNYCNIGIGVDFRGLTQAVMGAFSSSLPIVESQVAWFEHYGIFSTSRSYEDRGTPETFVQLEWAPVVGEEIETKLYGTEFKERYGWLELNPVEKILSAVELA